MKNLGASMKKICTGFLAVLMVAMSACNSEQERKGNIAPQVTNDLDSSCVREQKEKIFRSGLSAPDSIIELLTFLLDNSDEKKLPNCTDITT